MTSICVFDDFILPKNISNSNINVSIDQSNIYFNNILPKSTGIFIHQDGEVLIFKSIIGSNVNIVSNNTEIIINSASASFTNPTNVGTLSNIVFRQNLSNVLLFNTLYPSSGIAIVPTQTTIMINNTAPSNTLILTASTGITITGSYPNYNVSANTTDIVFVNRKFGRIYSNTTETVAISTNVTNLIVPTVATTTVMIGFQQLSNAMLTCTNSNVGYYMINGYIKYEPGPQGYGGYIAKNNTIISGEIISEGTGQLENTININSIATLIYGDYLTLKIYRLSGSTSTAIYGFGIITFQS